MVIWFMRTYHRRDHQRGLSRLTSSGFETINLHPLTRPEDPNKTSQLDLQQSLSPLIECCSIRQFGTFPGRGSRLRGMPPTCVAAEPISEPALAKTSLPMPRSVLGLLLPRFCATARHQCATVTVAPTLLAGRGRSPASHARRSFTSHSAHGRRYVRLKSSSRRDDCTRYEDDRL